MCIPCWRYSCEDGATHQILEDIGLMKMLPGMVVINPCDYNQTKAATMAIAEHLAQISVLDVQLFLFYS